MRERRKKRKAETETKREQQDKREYLGWRVLRVLGDQRKGRQGKAR
jgi:hypothetical protein